MKYSLSVVLLGIIAFSLVPSIYAQDITIGEKAKQELIQVEINLNGDIHVKHIIFPLDSPSSITLIEGTVSNVFVTDQAGNEKQFGTATGNNILLFPSKDRTVIEYDLEDVLILKEHFWSWKLQYADSVAVIFPDEIDLIYVNDNPVEISGVGGIRCHGCFMNLEYSTTEPKIFENVKWEDNEFVVEIRTKSEIKQFTFDQPTKSISFDVVNENEFVTTVIPLKLLWEPYTVFLNGEKFTQKEFSNGTHVWITIKPENSGNVSIIGTTVVPEFPIIAPLVLAFSAIIVMPFLGRIIRH